MLGFRVVKSRPSKESRSCLMFLGLRVASCSTCSLQAVVFLRQLKNFVHDSLASKLGASPSSSSKLVATNKFRE